MTDENLQRRSTDAAMLDMIRKLDEDLDKLATTIEAFTGGQDSETHRKQHEYLDLVIAREKERAAMRRAIIEKTLASLLWSALVGVAYAIWHTVTGKPSP